MDLQFTFGSKVMVEPHCVANHAAYFKNLGKRALIITGRSGAKSSGALDEVTAALDSVGIAWTQFDGVGANPLLSAVCAAAQQARDTQADFLIGIGGGSVLDATRATSAMAANTFEKPEDIYKNDYTNAMPFALIGTTAGTGSEVDDAAIITNDATGKKATVKSDLLFARYVFGDWRYTRSMSLHNTVSTGLDAMCHCIETLFSTAATEVTRTFALRGMELIFPRLQKIAAGWFDPNDDDFRRGMYLGSIWGGFCLTDVGSGFPHPMGYNLTEIAGLPHGVACALFETDFLQHSLPLDPEKAEALLAITGGEQPLYDTIATLTKNDFRLSPAFLDIIEDRLSKASNTKRALGTFGPAIGREMARKRYGAEDQTELVTGGWTFTL